MLGESLYRLVCFADALNAFGRCANLEPEQTAWMIGQGKCLIALRPCLEADARLRRCLELKKDSTDAKSFLAVALELQGKDKEAEDEFKDAIASAPSDQSLLRQFANLLLWEKEFLAAKKQYQAALKLSPDDPMIKQYIWMCEKGHGQALLDSLHMKITHN